MKMNRNSFLKLLGLSSLGTVFSSFDNKHKIKSNKVVIFTPELLKKYNTGLYIIKDGTDVTLRPGYAATVSFKLVYHHLDGRTVRGLCNFLTDGWTQLIGSEQNICDFLNHGSFQKYRIMTKEELIYIIENKPNPKQLFSDL